VVRINLAPPSTAPDGTGTTPNFIIVIMLKGWARFMYNDKLTLVKTGDCVHQRPGIVHDLFDYSRLSRTPELRVSWTSSVSSRKMNGLRTEQNNGQLQCGGMQLRMPW
jgi:hypothetical protein